MTAVPGQYQRVVIRGSAIEVISIEYRPKRQRDAWAQSAPGPHDQTLPTTPWVSRIGKDLS
jgi:hypothetical protein